MRRNSVVKKILRQLKTWENSRIEYRTANEVLKIVEQCEPTLYNSWDWSTKKRKTK
jgi:hypothetical protein